MLSRLRPTLPMIALFAVAGAPLHAQDVSVRAYVDRAQVALNQQFIYTVEVTGSQQIEGEPTVPDMADFANFLGSGTSQQVQLVNGQTSVSVSYQYRFQATKEGTFQIGSASVRVAGRLFTTAPVLLSISNNPGRDRSGGGDSANGIGPEDVFLAATAHRTRVYQNEAVVVEYRIYTRVNVNTYSLVQAPTATGFWVEEYPLPQSPTVETEVRNGVQYATAAIKKMAVFPTSAGTRTVEPMTIEAQVRVQRRSLDPFNDFFGGRSMFGRDVPVLVMSNPVNVEVLPLPVEGRPADFSGFVGSLDASASVDKISAGTNEPLTLRVVVRGQGNMQTLATPEVDFPSDFEVYPPEVSESLDRGDAGVGGSKTYEYVLIPRAPGNRTIPAIAFDFFSPSSGIYERASTTPITIAVTGDPVAGPVVASRGRGAIETLREDIRYIRLQPPTFRRTGGAAAARIAFWMTVLFPVVAVGGAMGFRRHRDRLLGDVAFARHRRAGRLARKRLSQSRQLVAVDTQKEFYAEAGRALQGFLGDKLNMAEAGMIGDEVRDVLSRRQVPDDVASGYLDVLAECDRQRFAPSEPSEQGMRAFVARAEYAMTALDKALSK